MESLADGKVRIHPAVRSSAWAWNAAPSLFSQLLPCAGTSVAEQQLAASLVRTGAGAQSHTDHVARLVPACQFVDAVAAACAVQFELTEIAIGEQDLGTVELDAALHAEETSARADMSREPDGSPTERSLEPLLGWRVAGS